MKNWKGQAKEAFERWYIKTNCKDLNLLGEIRTEFRMFYNVLTPSMQYGVYVDFFDSVGIEIMTPKKSALIWSWHIRDNSIIKRINSTLIFTSANEAQSAALTKASQIFNERLLSTSTNKENQEKLK